MGPNTQAFFFPPYPFLNENDYYWYPDTFELWCWRRLLRVPWTAERSNQSTLKQISPEYSLKGLTLKLKLQYFGHLMWKANSLVKTLMLGKTEGNRQRGWHRMRWWDSITNSMDMNLRKLQEIGEDRGTRCAAVHEVRVRRDLVTEKQETALRCFQNWSPKNITFTYLCQKMCFMPG